MAYVRCRWGLTATVKIAHRNSTLVGHDMHDIYEVYAGCDQLIVETSRAYLEQLLKEMSDIAAEHKS